MDHGTAAYETDTGDDLRRYTSRISVLESEIDLRHINRQKHGEAGSHRYESERTYARYLSLPFALGANGASEQHAEHKAEKTVGQIDLQRIEIVNKRCEIFKHDRYTVAEFSSNHLRTSNLQSDESCRMSSM